MSFMSFDESSRGTAASRMRPDGSELSSGAVGKALRLPVVALAAATLGACAQPVVGDKPGSPAFSTRQVSLEHNRKAFVRSRQAAVARTGHGASATGKPAAETQAASSGLASYYSDSQTASGERFDGRELTAAHRTLPFGTRLRITNMVTGRSVTVRVNDRGPFVPGRVVDVSPSAAETLGMVQQGVAKVKLDVVQ
jgi:rare lipoprotein A